MNHNLQINNIKALLLDLDGTLINSETAFFESFKKILKENFDVLITKEDYKKYELEQNAMLLKKIKEERKLKNFDDKKIMSLIYEDYEEEFKKVIMYQESIDNFRLLNELKLLNYKLALVTTCRRHYLNILLDDLSIHNLFDIIVAREDVEKLKPFPDAYMKAIEYLNVKPSDCLAFEDSKRGVDTSISCGIKTIKVDNFTSIKYVDDRTINFYSANEAFNKIIILKKQSKQ